MAETSLVPTAGLRRMAGWGEQARGTDRDSIPPGIATARRAGWPRFVLSLGVTAFGDPTAHVAMMREEVVDNGFWSLCGGMSRLTQE